MATKIKTGLFSGSFNPIHIGHLALANYLCEYEGLDELWFVVSPQNPLKEAEGMLDEIKRLKLVEVAIKDYPKFSVSDVELTLPRPSYTIHTLEYLSGNYPDREFTLIIGSDNWCTFYRWKDYQRILNECSIIIYPREGYPVRVSSLPPTARLVNAPMFEISATFIRDALAAGKNIEFFLHPETHRIIKKEGLYQVND